jgi:hypothetical protein
MERTCKPEVHDDMDEVELLTVLAAEEAEEESWCAFVLGVYFLLSSMTSLTREVLTMAMVKKSITVTDQ